MRTATVREFRDQATALLKATEPILVTRRGKIVGFFLPSTGAAVPLEIRRELFYALTDGVRRLSRAKGLSEEAVLADFKASKPPRRRR
jgi:hypothetical protein